MEARSIYRAKYEAIMDRRAIRETVKADAANAAKRQRGR